MTRKRIPAPVIGAISGIFPNHYTHSGLDGLFLTAGAPDRIPQGNKWDKVTEWLRHANQESPDPLAVLGLVIEDFMESAPPEDVLYGGHIHETNDAALKAFISERNKIREALAKYGLHYNQGGFITTGQGLSTTSLMEKVKKTGLVAVDIEIKRALKNVQNDPPAAVLAAGTVLEAVFKSYLEKKEISFYEKDTFSSLWKKCSKDMGLSKNIDDPDLKTIVSGLHNIAEGLMHLRNRKSASHGKSDSQIKSYVILPRHARLAVHAAHTLAVYVLEME